VEVCSHVVLVLEVAAVAHLAQPPQPVLADHVSVRIPWRMLVRALVAQSAVSRRLIFVAEWPAVVHCELVFSLQKVVEGEVVDWLGWHGRRGSGSRCHADRRRSLRLTLRRCTFNSFATELCSEIKIQDLKMRFELISFTTCYTEIQSDRLPTGASMSLDLF